MILNYLIAVLSATFWSVKYKKKLNLEVGSQYKRYLKKSVSLAICYVGFAKPWKLNEAWMAGKASFLCCAYDVSTDWRHFSDNDRLVLGQIFAETVPDKEALGLATELYRRELSDSLENDGLDRGAIALRFILKMMGCEKSREMLWGNLDEIGHVLQIVDDVLDFEHDLRFGDTNCLTTKNRNEYLRMLIRFSDNEAQRLFGRQGLVLVKVINKAKEKGQKFLEDKGFQMVSE